MELNIRDCGIKMRLVPYGGGWTDLYADFGDEEIYFIISNTMGPGFETLIRALYCLYPTNKEYEDESDMIDYKYGICKYIDDKYVVTEIIDDINEYDAPVVYQHIPWKAHFIWDEETATSNWTLEREANTETNFKIKLHIEHHRTETKIYDYEVKYEDLCYAVADACTKAMKKHGFNGYHTATYVEDINIRYLLFLKAVGLRNLEACETIRYPDKGKGEASNFTKEIELLLFDM